MKKFIGIVISILIPAFIMAGGMASSAVAQEKAKAAPAAKAEKGRATSKVLLENDKVRVLETHYKAGDVIPNAPRSSRVVRYLKGGTLMRTYADGKTEKIEAKTGEVRFIEAAQFMTKNVGKTEVVLYVVELK